MDLRELGQTPELGQPTSVTTCISRIERCSKWSASEEDMRIANAAVNTLTESLPSLNPEDQLRVWKALDSVKHGNLFLRIWAHVKGIQSYHDLQQNVATLSARVETELAPHSARFGQIYHRLQRQSSDPMMKNLVTKFYRHVSDEIPKANRATTKVAIQRHDVNSVHLQLLSANVRYLEYSLAHAMITLQQLEEKRHPPLLPTLGAQKRQERGAQLDDAIEETWQIIEALVVAGTPVNRTLNLDSHPEPFALLQGAIVAGRESLVRELVTRGACWESGERPEDSTRTLPQQSREDWEQFLQRAKHSNMNQVARTLIMCLVHEGESDLVQSGEYTRWTTENLFSSLNPHLIQKHANLFAALREMGASVLGEGAEGPENKPLLGADDDEAGPDFSDYDLDEGQGPEQYQ